MLNYEKTISDSCSKYTVEEKKEVGKLANDIKVELENNINSLI